MINLLYIDLFCGAGGTSTGVNSARVDGKQCAEVIACVNHDANAIASHAANHPDALHFTEDIRTLELSPLVAHVERKRAEHPEAKVVLWASLECTNFSKAKGGQPRDADSRTLAEHLFRYIEAVSPDAIQIENVEEFMSWGDVDANGRPVSMDKGRKFIRWVNNVKRYGYAFDYRIMNAADFGAYTSRKRFFGIFAKPGFPMVWPEPTHSKAAGKKESQASLFGSETEMKPWKPVRDVLDFSDEGVSIFARKKPIVDATLERIYAGLVKFIAGGKDAFIVKYNSMSQSGKYVAPGVDEPCPTVAVQNRLGVARVSFLSKQFSGDPAGKNQSLEQPAGSITTKDHHAFVTAYYGNGHNHSVDAPASRERGSGCSYGNGHNHSVDAPAPTVTCKDRLAVVNTRFVCSYSFKDTCKDISQPCPTILTKDRLSLVSPKFIDMQYGQGKPTSVDEPAGTVTVNPKHSVVTCNRFLLNPQFKSAGGSVEKPCFTLIARMDKMPPYLVSTEDGGALPSFIHLDGDTLIYCVYDDDTPAMVKVKEFMALYGITDIKMRMLNVGELKRIMGFPEEYVLVGTQAEQKKYIGNAVEVTIARAWCEALCFALARQKQQAAA
ncbi:MAG: DNA cytosine methyltransferase [Bacteroides sp.]|nr:DNA cytosine methyltransferase [Bacteroides sp.]